MKKLSLLFFLAVAVSFTACKKETKKKTTTPTKLEKSYPFSLQNAKNAINFVAYKTTEKIPVKGMFKKIEITKDGNGNTIKEALNGAEFKIPVSSIETNDSSRNFKIAKFFFGVMKNTLFLTGKINLNDVNNGIVEFTMNGSTQKLPFTYTINGKTFSLKTTMNIDEWNAQNAVKSLNEACKDLHKGSDGVSKTWSEVTIEVNSVFE